jgi:hypothetical protein
MRNAYHRSFSDAGTADRQIFDIDRADPFTTGLDDVLRPIGDLDVIVLIHDGEVTSVEPSVFEQRFSSR